MGNCSDPNALHAPEIFDAISQGFNMVFQMYKIATLVLPVLGMGPIPTFAPPIVPVGPVVGGTSIPIPGSIMTIPLGVMPGPTGEYEVVLTPFGK